MPRAIEAGTTVEYWRTLPGFPTSVVGASLKLHVAGAIALDAIDATVDGDAWKIRIEATATAGLTMGGYSWSERGYLDDDVIPVARGRVIVYPDIAEADDGDFVSWAEAALSLVEARITGRLTPGQDAESIQILGRAVSLIPLSEVLALRRDLRREIAAQQTGGGPQPVVFRFSRGLEA
jgi:hypothetical protein